MSKLDTARVREAIEAVLAGSQEKKRNFVETVELQITLKDYDTQRDHRFNGTVKLPHITRPNFKVCVLGDDKHCEMAAAAGIDCLSVVEMTKFDKDQKKVKKLARKYDAFLASQSVIPQIPRLFGPGLNKAQKFPSLLLPNDDINKKIHEVRTSVKFQLRKSLDQSQAIGNVSQTTDEIMKNAVNAINFFVSLLKKNWANVNTINIKSTMGKPQLVY